MDSGSRPPLRLAEEFGRSIADGIGAEAFIELQLSFATRLLPKFSDNSLIRMRQHILLHWDQSYFKSTLIDEFAKTVPKDKPVINISSMTPETLFGSISDDRKHIVKPVFAENCFGKIDELLGFLGTGNTMKDIVNTMNTGMEGKTVTRHLLKLGQLDFDKNKIEQLRTSNVNFDPNKAQLSHQPDFCIWAASRPMENRTFTYLKTSGHLYRYHILQHEISDEEAEHFFTKPLRPNLRLQEELAVLNRQLAGVAVKNLSLPDEQIMVKILPPLKDIVKDEIASEKRRLAEVIDIRTQGDIMREIAAHAFLRTVAENDFRDIEKLEYTSDDIEFILRRIGHFVEFKINPLFADEFTERKHKKRPREQVKELVPQFLFDKEMRSRREIEEYVNNKMTVGNATISATLVMLLEEHRICQPKYGSYILKEDCKTCKCRDSCLSKTE